MVISIEEVKKPATNIDTSLYQPPPMDLSSIQAQVQGIAAETTKLVEQYKLAQEQATKMAEATTKTEPQGLVDKTKQGALSIMESIFGKKTETSLQDYITQRNELQKSYLEQAGISQDIIDRGAKVTAEIQSLDAQLNALTMQEQAEKLQATAGFGLSSRKGAVEAEISRRYAIQKSNIAAEMAIKIGEYNITQGRIDEAKKNFDRAIEYATYKETEEKNMWQWALNYYTDLDREEKRVIQEKFDNAIKMEQLAIQKAELKISQIREARLREETVKTSSGFSDEIINGLNAKKTPEEVARRIFETYNDLGYKLDYQQLLKEAIALSQEMQSNGQIDSGQPQIQTTPQEKKKGFWKSFKDWLKPELPYIIEEVNYKKEHNLPLDEREKRAKIILERQAQMQNSISSSPLANFIKNLWK